jgi:hypothetical protein
MQSKIEQQVMAGVGVVYAARQLVSTTALKLYVCVLSLYGIGRLVWVSHVFDNWSRVGLDGTFQFVTSAVLHTHLPVQIALLVLAIAAAGLIRDLARLSTPSKALAY